LLFDDLADMVSLANNWQVAHFTASLPYPYTVADGQSFLSRCAEANEKECCWAIAERRSNRLIGMIGLIFHPEEPYELGYWLGRPHWGQGFATEAVQALAQTLGGPLVAYVFPENVASSRVLEKAGFGYAGFVTQDFPARGGIREVAVYRYPATAHHSNC
jgi:RimJ/RimL family protein N-acetyltransferase